MKIFKLLFFITGVFRGLIIGCKHLKTDTRIISFLNEPAFGHKITGLDYLARLFPREKIILYVLVNNKINPYLFDLYRDYIESRFIYPYSSKFSIFNKCISAETFGLKKGIEIAFVLRSIEFFIPHPVTLYRAMNTNYEKMEVFRFSDNKMKIPYETFYSHGFLLENNELAKIHLREEDVAKVYTAIGKYDPDAPRKVVSIILRNDAANHQSFHDQNRDAGPFENYFDAISHLSSSGYTVLLFGDKNFSVTSVIRHVIEAKKLECDQDLLNIFSLTKSEFVVMQHSGPVHLANIASVPLVIADFLPLWQGSCGKKDIFVPKNFYNNDSGLRIPLKTLLSEYTDLFFGGYQLFPRITIFPSEKEDITDAVIEMVDQLKLENNFSIDQELLKTYYKYIPSKSLHAYRRNRISNKLLKKEFS